MAVLSWLVAAVSCAGGFDAEHCFMDGGSC